MPIGICLQRESKNVLQGAFGKFFRWCKTAEREGIPAIGEQPHLKPIKLVGTGDMSFESKLLGTGGACKVMYNFCPWCEVHGDQNMWFTRYGSDVCELCRHNAKDSCTHRTVNDYHEIQRKGWALLDLILTDQQRKQCNTSLTLADILPNDNQDCFNGFNSEGVKLFVKVNLKQTLSPDGSLTRPINDYCRHLLHMEESDDIIARTCMVYDPRAVSKLTTPNNTDYIYRNNSSAEDNAFMGNVFSDLRLRGLSGDSINAMTLEERVSTLKRMLMTRMLLKTYRDALRIDEDASAERMLDPGQVIPCILHHNNRTTEKILQLLLKIALRQNSDRMKEVIKEIEDVVNRHVIGRSEIHEKDDGGWHVPMSEDRKSLGDVNLSNSTARLFVKKFEAVVEVCLCHETSEFMKSEWIKIVCEFRQVAQWLDSREQFNFDKVAAFQLDVDNFCQSYFNMVGRDGMTNYFHLLYAGHYSYFLLKYGNLYRYSQQGWENVNSVLKRSFHNNTQKGGGRAGGSSKLTPVFMRISRGMLWRYGYLDGLFESLGYKHDLEIQYGTVKPMPKYNNARIGEIEKYSNTLFNFLSQAVHEELLETIDEEEVDLSAEFITTEM
jgi:hypothetical protein